MDLITAAQLLGNFGEFFGAIAVVATLIYLGIQIRQGNSATQAASRDAAMAHTLSFFNKAWTTRLSRARTISLWRVIRSTGSRGIS